MKRARKHRQPSRRPLQFAVGALSLALLTVLACRSNAGPVPEDEVVARVDGEEITLAEALERAAPRLEQLEQQATSWRLQISAERYSLLEQTIEGLVRDRLVLAKAEAEGVEPDVFRDQHLERFAAAVTEAEIDEFFAANEGRIRGARDEVAPQVRLFLAQNRWVEFLEAGHEIDYLRDPYRLDADPADGPVRGSESARITIVEWSDFECPFCKQVVPTLEQVLDEYPDDVRLAFRHFPLTRIHANAQGAAEAAVCAQDLGAFWEFHDLMFEEQEALTADDLKDKAARAGLDAEEFAACLERDDLAERVAADRRAGAALGVSGTPALFVNGRPLEGAATYEQLVEVIQDELELMGE